MDDSHWDAVDRLVAWLDGASPLPREVELPMRILKLSEEVGEVAQALIGTLGQNPRKGITHTSEDVESELCDVILTAMVALASYTPDARKVFDRRVAVVCERSLTDRPADSS